MLTNRTVSKHEHKSKKRKKS